MVATISHQRHPFQTEAYRCFFSSWRLAAIDHAQKNIWRSNRKVRAVIVLRNPFTIEGCRPSQLSWLMNPLSIWPSPDPAKIAEGRPGGGDLHAPGPFQQYEYRGKLSGWGSNFRRSGFSDC
jgi:hypothetical protein